MQVAGVNCDVKRGTTDEMKSQTTPVKATTTATVRFVVVVYTR